MPRTAQNVTTGVHPNYLNRLIEVDAEETPAFSLLPKGDPLSNPIAQYPIDDRDTASKEGVLDNTPTEGATEEDNYRILESPNHMLDELISVGKKANTFVDQAGIGKGKQYLRVLTKKQKAIKTAFDQITCDDAEARLEGVGGKGSETRGMFRWCQSTAQAVKPVDPLYRTPAGQISTVNHDEFYEETFQGLLNEHHDATGREGKFTAIAGIFWKQKVSNWTVLDSGDPNFSYIRRFSSDASQERKVLNAVVNVLVCDGGRVEVHKSRNLLWERSPSSRREISPGKYTGAFSMIGWHEGCAEYRFGWEPSHEPLAKRGGGEDGHIDMCAALCCDPTGMIKHVPAALT